MAKSSAFEAILETAVIAVIRMTDSAKLIPVVKAVNAGGIRCIEITMTVPNAVTMLKEVGRTVGSDVVLGAGTVTDPETAEAVIDNGASFVVSPILDPAIIETCQNRGVVVVPGCYTPTEIFAASRKGCDFIKVFPATSLGPDFIKDLRGPFPNLRLVPTGGVTIENVGDWIRAGAAAVGIGSDLLDKEAIRKEHYAVLTDRAARLASNVARARAAR